MRPGSLALALAAVVSAAGCRSDATGIEAVAINLVLDSAAVGHGAIVFTLSGAPVVSFQGPGGEILWAPAGPGAVRVVYVGTLAPGVIGRVLVPDGQIGLRYGVLVEQVALSEGFRLVSPADFRISAGSG